MKAEKKIFFFLLFTALLSASTFCFGNEISSKEIERLIPHIMNKLPHERAAFTQGLAFDDNERLYESTGLYGRSTLRVLNPANGEIQQIRRLGDDVFAEGIAAFPDQIIQLTWQNRKVFVFDPISLNLKKVFYYSGEGWGLCRDGQTVWLSDGSSKLYQRDLSTFSLLNTLHVYLLGLPVDDLNDLECVGNELFVNVWKKNWILRIDKLTGKVSGIIDASALLSQKERASLGANEVLNGIAYHPKRGTFFLTGKDWPWIFEVRFVPQMQSLIHSL